MCEGVLTSMDSWQFCGQGQGEIVPKKGWKCSPWCHLESSPRLSRTVTRIDSWQMDSPGGSGSLAYCYSVLGLERSHLFYQGHYQDFGALVEKSCDLGFVGRAEIVYPFWREPLTVLAL